MKKTEKKLTNVCFVCMYVGRKSEMLFFSSVFAPTVVLIDKFPRPQGKKQKNVSFYGVCVYVRPKLTFVFLCFFFEPFPDKILKK